MAVRRNNDQIHEKEATWRTLLIQCENKNKQHNAFTETLNWLQDAYSRQLFSAADLDPSNGSH